MVTRRGISEARKEDVTSGGVRVVGRVKAHAYGGRDPKHSRMMARAGFVAGEIKLLGPTNKKVSGSIAGYLRVMSVVTHAVTVGLRGELVMMKPSGVTHVIAGAQFKGPMC